MSGGFLLLAVFACLSALVCGSNDCFLQNHINLVVDEAEPKLLLKTRRQDYSDLIDCHPDPNASREKCEARGCVYDDSPSLSGPPYCYFPNGYGYNMVGQPTETKDGYIVHLVRSNGYTIFGGESQEVWVQVYFQNNHRLRISVSDYKPRFTVPIDIPSDGVMPDDPLYEVTFTASPTFGLRVTRRSTGETVIDTSLPGLVFSDQFIQMPVKLPEGSNLYGWGEDEQHSFAHDMNWKTWAIFSRDQPPDGDSNMYGVHPRLTILDKNGDAAGVLFLNSAAQELSVTPLPGFIYRTIGGILDMYVFLGPGPEEVVQQYTAAVGRFYIPPYWSLGFHLCKYGYNDMETMQAARNRTAKYGIPQDAQWGDIDIMERSLDFTVDEERFGGLPQYVRDLKKEGVKFVTILDPCISTGEPNCTYRPFDLGEQMGIWIRKPNGEPVLGRVWPEDPTYFPDYTNPRTHEWWALLIAEFQSTIAFDGLWIDMNEPANFVAGNLNEGCAAGNINYPPYIPRVRMDSTDHGLSDKTLCPDSVHTLGNHYDIHSLSGWSQSSPTLTGVMEATGKRGLVLSRSTYVGSGRWVAHWLGDNFSNWNNLKYSIIGMLQFNQFGIPMVGADICGFIGNTEPELCSRWQQLGAFYPFSRNHNALGSIDQDPGVFGDEIARISREALTIRYTILPYLYTLFYQHHVEGGTVARALWHEFPRDNITWPIDNQFLLGPAFLVSPVLEEGADSRDIYLPKESRWYDVTSFFDVSKWNEITTGWRTVAAPQDVIPLHVRGGFALPLQQPAVNTMLSRDNPFELLFALNNDEAASGTLYYDDGDSIDPLGGEQQYFLGMFSMDYDTIEMKVEHDGYPEMQFLHVERIIVLGSRFSNVNGVIVNGETHNNFTYSNGNLQINGLNISINDNWQIILEY